MGDRRETAIALGGVVGVGWAIANVLNGMEIGRASFVGLVLWLFAGLLVHAIYPLWRREQFLRSNPPEELATKRRLPWLPALLKSDRVRRDKRR